MNFHPKQQHTQQRPGQNQGHRERDHGAGAKAEAQKADEQHRRQGLEEGAREFADGGLDHPRLISDPLNFNPDRKSLLDSAHGHFQRLS